MGAIWHGLQVTKGKIWTCASFVVQFRLPCYIQYLDIVQM